MPRSAARSRLVLLNVGGGWPGDLDKSDARPSRQIHLLRRRERGREPVGAVPCREGLRADDSTVFVIAAEPPHSVTNHVAERPRGHPRQHLLGDEHDRQQQRGVVRPLRGRDRPGARADDRRQGLDPARRAQLSAHERLRTCSASSPSTTATAGSTTATCRNGTSASRSRASRSCRAPTTSTCS